MQGGGISVPEIFVLIIAVVGVPWAAVAVWETRQTRYLGILQKAGSRQKILDELTATDFKQAYEGRLERGLDWLAQIGEALGGAITTDIHDPSQAEPVAACVDLIQIPAFLCRQTDLLAAAARAAVAHGRAVNVKKGQFLSPGEMVGPVAKLAESGCSNVMLTERGTFFGYHRLVNDFVGLGDLMELGPPVCFDATHSTQLPGTGEQSGGRPERAPLLAAAAVAAGVHALFIEVHPDPSSALSDSATVLDLGTAESVLARAAAIHAALL